MQEITLVKVSNKGITGLFYTHLDTTNDRLQSGAKYLSIFR